MTWLYVFVAQFVAVFLLGLQQHNVQGRHFKMAFITSVALGLSAYYTIGTIAHEEFGSAVWWAYLAAGPFAICLSMWLHPKLIKWWRR